MNWEEELEKMTKMSQEEIEERISELVKLEKPINKEDYEKFKEGLKELDEHLDSEY